MPTSLRVFAAALEAIAPDGSSLPNLATVLTQAVVSVAMTNLSETNCRDASNLLFGCR